MYMCAEVILKFQLLAIIHVQIKSDSAVSISLPGPLIPPPLVIHGHLIVIHAPGVGSLNIAWVGGEFEPVEYFLVI